MWDIFRLWQPGGNLQKKHKFNVIMYNAGTDYWWQLKVSTVQSSGFNYFFAVLEGRVLTGAVLKRRLVLEGWNNSINFSFTIVTLKTRWLDMQKFLYVVYATSQDRLTECKANMTLLKLSILQSVNRVSSQRGNLRKLTRLLIRLSDTLI